MASRKIRVGVSGHDLKFWYPLQRRLELSGKYEFREDIWTGHDEHDEKKSRALLDWADVLVAEWALGNAVYYSRNKRIGQHLVVRLHLQERGTRSPADIDYSKVDHMVFVGAHILRECADKFSIPAAICSVIGNFIDVEKYDLPKFGGAEHTLGIIGTAPSRKRLDLALDTLESLSRRDDRYVLRVKGASPASIPWLWARVAERDYYQRAYSRINSSSIRHKVIFDPQGNDVHHWLQMVGTVLSPSDFESFHMAVAEGAASSAIPALWSWEGANEVYPEFTTVDSPEEAAFLIEFLNQSASGARYRKQVREVMRERYDSSVIMAQWEEALTSLPVGHGAASVAGLESSKGLIVVWAIDNWVTFHRREMLEALANNIAADFDVLVIEPGNYHEAISRLGWCSDDELARITKGELIQVSGNLSRARLLTGGIPNGAERANYQGCSVDQLQVLDRLIDHHFGGNRDVIHWVYKPDQAHRLGSQRRFIYEVYDEYGIDFGSGEEIPGALELERTIIPLAQHVFFTSKPLLDRKAANARNVTLAGNGVKFDAFAKWRVEEPMSGRPVAAYLGNLSDFFDWALMESVCAALPEIDFIFHGQIETDKLGDKLHIYESMAGLKNVQFSGRVTREIGAAALNRYDVLLIPFVVNDAMHAVNPLKLWEYFATGKPVVYSPMAAIEEAEPLAFVADGVDEWLAAIRRCLEGDAISEEAKTARISKAEEHQWARLTETHAAIIRELAGSRHAATNNPAYMANTGSWRDRREGSRV